MKYLLFIVCFFWASFCFAQQNKINPDGYNTFYYANGQISSEGIMVNGLPDGYWKTYYENGKLKSEGNRKNFQLDSLWKFYDESEKLILEITYRNDKKNGIRRTFQENEVIEENFVDDLKQGNTLYYYPDGKIKKRVPFVNGIEDGMAYEYDQDGIIITLIEYKKGFIVNRDKINRKDRNNLKQGKWVYFYDSGRIRMEGVYRDDMKNGYFKQYDREGNLVVVEKYIDDNLQENVAELVELDVRTDYYPSGKIKTVASYKDGVPEGIRREYSEDGRILTAYTFRDGQITGQGIMTEQGIKQGPWKEYYSDGKLKAEGDYSEGKKVGGWKYYYPDGTLEQEGYYNTEGLLDALWKWYYPSGALLREENYLNGLADGSSVEYDENGNIVTSGEYIEDKEEGKWFYNIDGAVEEGTYRNGLRNGSWTSYYQDGQLRFSGEFIDDNPNGKHICYWGNGKLKEEGRYVMGLKEGDWMKYDPDGTLFIVISYENGIETKYDGIKIRE
jgi:antitoxin component YwqK of YwqJK toxin-antitoxin module